MNEIEALLQLTSIPLLGSIKIQLLIRHFGSALAALDSSPIDLVDLPGFNLKVIESWKKHSKDEMWKNAFTLAQEHSVDIIPYTHPLYPKRLLEIPDYPLVLYVQGTLLPEHQRSIAVVGTRQATVYGIEMARKISKDLSNAGFTIVSGFARGIDTAAHDAVFERGRTIAVMGCGLAHIYPKENIVLAQGIMENGALISEFPINTPPDRQLFPQRNRIVSGMTLGTLLIEAPLQSGAMITMERALSQGRKTFALPGRADSDNFRGNHFLIKNQQAILVENAQDILNYFTDFVGPISSQSVSRKHPLPLEKEEQYLLQFLPEQEFSIEEIHRKVQLSITKLSVLLMSLVVKKVLKEYPGKIYKLT